MKLNNLIFYISVIILITSCKNELNKQTIMIPEGKVGLIGFGSLMSLNKTEEIFNHKYTDSIYLVHLDGFQRTWDCVASNYDPGYTEEELKHDGYYIQGNDTLMFDNSVYLNITEKEGVSMNCVLYFITEDELKEMDLWEFGYDRIDVSKKISEYNFKGGKIYAYKSKPENIYDPTTTEGVTKIHQDYVNLVRLACDSIGSDFRQEYNVSTIPFDPKLMAPIIWRKVR